MWNKTEAQVLIFGFGFSQDWFSVQRYLGTGLFLLKNLFILNISGPAQLCLQPPPIRARNQMNKKLMLWQKTFP